MLTIVLRATATLVCLMLLFPPFVGEVGAGQRFFRGYGLLFSPPVVSEHYAPLSATVDVGLLATQVAAVTIVALLVWLSSRR